MVHAVKKEPPPPAAAAANEGYTHTHTHTHTLTFPWAQPLAGPISCLGLKFTSGRTLMVLTNNELYSFDIV